MKFVKILKKINKSDISIAGGKGANLGELMKIGILVPPGFVILSTAFEYFLEKADLNIEIDSILHSVDIKKMHTIEDASEKIKALILGATVPDEIIDETKKSFKELDVSFVAVRSSATSEDSKTAAWAGQLETYLNTTEQNLLKNIKKCWASLFTSRAIFYCFEKGLHKEKISVAVVVQKMVESEKSGVAFSVHPVTQNKNQLIIEAIFGLGEAIVSGKITPDSYVVEKQRWKLLDKNINEQRKMLVKAFSGGNEWKELLKEYGKKQVLSDKDIVQLSKLIVKIENHYGFPVDVEWVMEREKFYIVQSRPITTISEIEIIQAYRKIMTRPLSLIDCECWDIGERIKLPEKFKNLLFFDPLFIYTPKKAVAVYYNFTDPKQNLQPLITYIENNLSWFKKEKIKFNKNCQKIRTLIKNKNVDYKEIAELNHEIWPTIAVANVLGSTEFFKVSDNLKKICVQIREESDDVLHPSLTYLNNLIFKKLKIKDIQNISLTEVLNNNIPNKIEIKKREKGWVYHKKNIIFDAKKYFKENNIQIINPTKKQINVVAGNTACKGFVRGRARVIFELSELDKVQKGNVLITPMTTPEMIPALKKASAIITDEGGITCHAAIVSRELNIPCIIGTVNATQNLHDGDLLEVNADNGTVIILKKTKE